MSPLLQYKWQIYGNEDFLKSQCKSYLRFLILIKQKLNIKIEKITTQCFNEASF